MEPQDAQPLHVEATPEVLQERVDLFNMVITAENSRLGLVIMPHTEVRADEPVITFDMEMILGGVMYKCPVCLWRFSDIVAINRHYSWHVECAERNHHE